MRGAAAHAFGLAAACCRPLASADRPAAVRRAADGVDWPRFLLQVDRHRIAGLAVRALRDAGVQAPPDILVQLTQRAERGAQRSLALAAETVRLQSALDAADISNLVLKGAPLAQLVWGGFGLKEAFDIDLLIAPEQARAAAARLRDLGYRPFEPTSWPQDDPAGWDLWIRRQKDLVLVGAHHEQIVVELHWKAVETAGLAEGVNVSSPARLVSLSPRMSLRTLAEEETFAHLCAHGGAHAWARLKWLADLAQLLQPLSPEARGRLRRRALALGAGRSVDLALSLAERLLGVRAPPRPGPDVADRLLLALSLHAMGSARDPAGDLLLRDVISLSRLLHLSRPEARRRELARIWESPRDRRLLGPSSWAQGLRHPLRLPLWLWRRVAHALAAGRTPSQ